MIYSIIASIWFSLSIATLVVWITSLEDNKFIYDILFVLRYGKLFHKFLMLIITALFIPFTIPKLIIQLNNKNKK